MKIEIYAFGDVLKSFRQRKQLSQQALANLLGTHRNTISNWERGNFLPKSKTMVLELARLLCLDEQETRQLLEASLTALTPHWSLPFPRNPLPAEREELLQTLHQVLHADQNKALPRNCAIYGLGGSGKTQLAIEYAYRYALEYTAVFWINASDVERLTESFQAIAQVLQVPTCQETTQRQIVAAVHSWLAQHRDWLLIWHNGENLDLMQQFFPPALQGATLLA